MKASVKFEQLVARIFKLIGDRNDTVISDHHIEDPDTGTLRQIDILIERGGKKIFVECRDHARPQDVTWIESLIGRRESLCCDLIIGVSSSGFRKSAVQKALAKGVILRAVTDVSDFEIEAWGNSWIFEMELICYASLCIHLTSSKFVACVAR